MVVNYDAQASQHIFQELGEQRRNNFCAYRGKNLNSQNKHRLPLHGTASVRHHTKD